MTLQEAIKHIRYFFIDFPCEEDNEAIALVLSAAEKLTDTCKIEQRSNERSQWYCCSMCGAIGGLPDDN